MKVIIQKNIVDTKDIFAIGEIHEIDEGFKLEFEITFYNCKERTYVQVKSGIPYNGNMAPSQIYKEAGVENWSDYEFWIRKQPCYVEALAKFTEGWQKLVDLWSNNQSTISKIEFQ